MHSCARVNVVSPKTLRAKHYGFILPNGVKCIIAHDSSATMPAIVMSIGVGSFNDPENLPGLAHFCEHMLFMGTAKYPKEDEYSSYIEKNNGHCNAFTTFCSTTYFFDINDEALEGALERFIEFFVSPSFNESAVNREVQMVHSEDMKNHNDDNWRFFELRRTFVNEKHPMRRYGNGNATTLVEEPKKMNIDLRARLQEFYAQHYRSSAACIMVYSARSPEEILKLIEDPLMRMQIGPVPSAHFLEADENPLHESAVTSWVNIRTLKKSRTVRLYWFVRSSIALWKSSPRSYVTHILGHECDSSIFGVLKSRGMATSLSVYSHRIDNDYEELQVTIKLTTEGFCHLCDVISMVYHGIGHAIHEGIQKDVYEQMKMEMQLMFESSEVHDLCMHCVNLTSEALTKGVEHAWVGDLILLEDNYDECIKYAAQLTPKNGIVCLEWGEFPTCVQPSTEVTQPTPAPEDTDGKEVEEKCEVPSDVLFNSLPDFAQVKANKTTRFCKTVYSQVRIPSSQIAKWEQALKPPYPPELALPAPNPYLASDFTIFPTITDKPAEAVPYSFPYGTIIVRKDMGHHNTFNTAIILNSISPVAYDSPLGTLYKNVAELILKHTLAELTYYGTLASLKNEYIDNPGGISIYVFGPYHRLFFFLQSILEKAFDKQVLSGTEEQFKTYLDVYVRGLESKRNSQPFNLCINKLAKMSSVVYWDFEDVLETAGSATYGGYKAFVSQYLNSGFLFECIVTGNVPSDDVIQHQLAHLLEGIINAIQAPTLETQAIPRFRDSLDIASRAAGPVAGAVASLDVIVFPPYNPEDANVAVLLDINVGAATARAAALTQVSATLLSSSFFNILRTKESLGYVVTCRPWFHKQSCHVVFLAQSARNDVDSLYLLSRMVAFLAAVADDLKDLCAEAEVGKARDSLIVKLEKLPDSVSIDAEEVLCDYISHEGLQQRAQQIAALRQLASEDVQDFFARFLLNSRTDVRGLALVIDSARCACANELSALNNKNKTHFLTLPPMHFQADPSSIQEECVCSLKPPSFEEGTSHIEVNYISSISSFQERRKIFRSQTF